MILKVGKIIYSLLTSDEKLNKVIDKKVYPLIADIDTSFPFIVYRRGSVELYTSKDRYINNELATVEIIVATDNYNESIEVAQMVKDALHNKRGKIAGFDVTNISLVSADEDYLSDAFIQRLNFKIEL